MRCFGSWYHFPKAFLFLDVCAWNLLFLGQTRLLCHPLAYSALKDFKSLWIAAGFGQREASGSPSGSPEGRSGGTWSFFPAGCLSARSAGRGAGPSAKHHCCSQRHPSSPKGRQEQGRCWLQVTDAFSVVPLCHHLPKLTLLHLPSCNPPSGRLGLTYMHHYV